MSRAVSAVVLALTNWVIADFVWSVAAAAVHVFRSSEMMMSWTNHVPWFPRIGKDMNKISLYQPKLANHPPTSARASAAKGVLK